MGLTTYIVLLFVIGIAVLGFGSLYKKNRRIRLAMIVLGAVLTILSVAAALFLMFVLIPAM
jgi:hypothetical protein